jgi:hypothetical protein
MGYNKFMEFGVELQQNSITVDEATRNYARSCEKCRLAGIDCDRCPITIAHHEKLEAILTLRQAEHEKKVREDELRRKLDECIKMMESIYAMMYNPSQLDEQNDRLDHLTDEWLKLKGRN